MSESAGWLSGIIQHVRLRLLFVWWDCNHLETWLPPDAFSGIEWSLQGLSERHSVLWQWSLHKQYALFHAGGAVPFTRRKYTARKEKNHFYQSCKKRTILERLFFVCDPLALVDNSNFQWALILVSCAVFNKIFESKIGNDHKKCFSLSIWVTLWGCKIEL